MIFLFLGALVVIVVVLALTGWKSFRLAEEMDDDIERIWTEGATDQELEGTPESPTALKRGGAHQLPSEASVCVPQPQDLPRLG